VARLVRAYPEVECTIRSGDHERVVALLLDGVVELGLVTWPCAEADAAALQPVLSFQEPVVLAASPAHPLATRGRVGVEEVARLGRPMFRLRWWQRHDPVLLRLAERAGPAVELPMETARALALDGAGVGFFVRTYIAEDLARGALVAIPVRDLPPVRRETALVRRRRSGPLSPAAANLVEAIRARARELGLARATRRQP
jgi:DNA-binding transcriptional LysR family regulator